MANRTRKAMQEFVQRSIIEDGITTFQCKPHTVVEMYSLVYDVAGREVILRGVGHAKLGKNDTWNPVLGYEVACGRAIDDIIKQYGKI